MSWSALIVDDEHLARRNLEHALRAHPQWQVAGECANASAARVALQQQPADLVLLDIQMPLQNGLELAQELCELAQPPLVVFVSAYDEHALSAFEVHALDYLLKPFDSARFALMLQRAEDVLQLKQTAACAQAIQAFVQEQQARQAHAPVPPLRAVTVRSSGRIERVELATVEWIGGAANYVSLNLPGRELLHRATLSSMEQHLPAGEFLRVHRTALVRRTAVQSLRVLGPASYELTLLSGARVPVSDRYVEAVRALF